MRLANLRIGQRLTIGFGMVIAVIMAVILFGAAKLMQVNKNVEAMVNERYPQTSLANSIKSDLFDVVQAMRDVLFDTDLQDINSRMEGIEQSMQFAGQGTDKLNAKAAAGADEEDLKRAMNEARERFKSELNRFTALIKAQQRDQAKDVLYTSVQAAQTIYFQTLDQVIAFHAGAMVSTSQAAMKETQRAVTVMLALASAACIFAVMIGVLVTRSITRPLSQAVDLARRVAEGDLTASVEARSRDETGMLVQSLKDMNESLVRIVSEVRSGIDTIATASAEIANGNMDLASRTEQQAGSLERTVSSMDGLTTTVRQNADNAHQANALAATASQVAIKGGAVVGQVVETMESINESARKIVDIISVIDGIAFQTNILALNAAVEAARAGEQGRGFAVVASEVRNLAQRSAAAAKEIKALIGDSVDRVNTGSKLVGQAGATMDEVVESVRRVTAIMAEISSASALQSASIGQINQAITQIDETTTQNAALVEEAAAAAERMREEAAQLAQAVSVFRLNDTADGKAAELDATPVKSKTVAAVAMGNAAGTQKLAARAQQKLSLSLPILRSEKEVAGIDL
jgi:methyl-accepting chemotaxis protein